ncbi:VOC family protein [Dactylosporangium sp. NPDC049742]|uniref:VOC family protein n=1 Tax=unclassified Dactylosporangium TaxID=2621675 RepID=UPI001EDE7330|nr:VOC family protein [Dactylosporangium sp. AC04546]WVK86573.1 VOC family protein [Dactylosporangium sp. AC04546]
MSWSLHHVNLPASDVRAMAAFYSKVFGMQEKTFPFVADGRGALETGNDFVALFEDHNQRQIHICKPTPSLPWDNQLRLHPVINGHIAIEVDDIDGAMRRLDELGMPYNDTGTWALKGYRQVYCYDPSMNVVEINQKHP